RSPASSIIRRWGKERPWRDDRPGKREPAGGPRAEEILSHPARGVFPRERARPGGGRRGPRPASRRDAGSGGGVWERQDHHGTLHLAPAGAHRRKRGLRRG